VQKMSDKDLNKKNKYEEYLQNWEYGNIHNAQKDCECLDFNFDIPQQWLRCKANLKYKLCVENQNCHYRQLQAKTDENTALKQQLDITINYFNNGCGARECEGNCDECEFTKTKTALDKVKENKQHTPTIEKRLMCNACGFIEFIFDNNVCPNCGSTQIREIITAKNV